MTHFVLRVVCNKESVSRVMRARHVARKEGCCWETGGKRQVRSPGLRWEENIKMDLKGIVLLKARSEFIWLK